MGTLGTLDAGWLCRRHVADNQTAHFVRCKADLHPNHFQRCTYLASYSLILASTYCLSFTLMTLRWPVRQGWKSISSVDIDEPEPYGTYFGCEHEEENNVKPKDHPFAHVQKHLRLPWFHKWFLGTQPTRGHADETPFLSQEETCSPTWLWKFSTSQHFHGWENYCHWWA